MARPREFDPVLVLDRAVDLFWRQGYEATSMAELTEHLGVGRASLYACFGSKHDLYVKALQHYVQSRDSTVVELLSQPGPVLPAVRAMLEAAISSPASSARGCMVTNASVECADGDARVLRSLEGSWAELETVLTCALTRARAEGEVGAGVSPRPTARMLLVLLQGLHAMDRCGADEQRRRDAVDAALATLT